MNHKKTILFLSLMTLLLLFSACVDLPSIDRAGWCDTDVHSQDEDLADSVDDSDTADTGDSGDDDFANTGDSSDDGDSVDDGDSANTGNTGEDKDAVDTGDSVDDSDTGNTGNSVDDSDTGNTGDSVDDSDTGDTGNSVDDSDTGNSAPECGDGTVNGDEACELTDTKGCTTFTGAGFESGTATCLSDCTAWDKTACECPENFIIDGDGNCIVNNECTLGTHNCDTNATCTDTSDSFTCACKDYYDGDGTSCIFCTTDSQCTSNCTACDSATPKCKNNGDTTSQCVECLTSDDCTSPTICSLTNLCLNCTVESWNFSATSSGRAGTIQSWIVPFSGRYSITAYGAQGGSSAGGLGAKMAGDFTLTQSTIIKILVGQRGTDYNNASSHVGGGGGTFVVKDGATNETGIYVIAGGGGGAYSSSNNKRHGTVSTSGNAGDGHDFGFGGTAGNGGGGAGRGSGGGGFYTNGEDAGLYDEGFIYSKGGFAYLNGGAGGDGVDNGTGKGVGGFGSGGGIGGTGNYNYGGGGGGYSGGGGGGDYDDFCAGGGGSYNSGTIQNNVGGNRLGDGYVTITRLCD